MATAPVRIPEEAPNSPPAAQTPSATQSTVVSLTPQQEATLPMALKGYELYSWQEKGSWHFTLMSGTDRIKTLEEIVSGENVVSQDSWVRISVVGSEALKALLKRLPRGSEVGWVGEEWSGRPAAGVVALVYPPPEQVAEIKSFCINQGITLLGGD